MGLHATYVFVSHRWRGAVLCLCLAGWYGLAGCGGSSDGGTRPVARTVHFDPSPTDTTIGTLQTLRIRALGDDGVAVLARFSVDGAGDTTATQWDFVGPVEGAYAVRASSTLDGVDYSGLWNVTVSDGAVPPTPPVTGLTASPGVDPGSIELQWQAPPPSQVPVPLTQYVIAYADVPFEAADFDNTDHVVVGHDPLAIIQRARLGGLLERRTYYIRMRVEDTLGRQSVSSNPVQYESTGHFDVSGTVQALAADKAVGLHPLPNVLIEVQGEKSLSDASGYYELLNLPDIMPSPMTAQEQAGSNYYVYQTSPLDPVSRTQPIVLFEQNVFEIIPDDGSPGVVMNRLEYFRRMTENYSNFPYVTNPWQSYPIPFYVGEYISTGGDETISYRQVFLDAIDAWNQAAADSLIRPILGDVDPIANPGLVGARFVADLSATGDNRLLGQVRIVRPAGGLLYEVTPEFADVHMINQFVNRQVATLVAIHELGHVLGVAHSPNRQDIMYRAVVRSAADGLDLTEEEALVARLLKALPPQTDLRWYTSALNR